MVSSRMKTVKPQVWYFIGKIWNSMPENFCSWVFPYSSTSRMFYLWHVVFNDKGHIMVLTSSDHSMVVCRGRVRPYRVNSLILRINNGISVVISHPIVDYLLSTYLDCILEQRFLVSSVFLLLGAYPVPVGGCQALIGFLGLEGFLGWGPPHEVIIAVVRVLVQHILAA